MKRAGTKILFQSQVEAAMKVTRSNRSAAVFLRVSYNFYKRYAKSYFNKEGVSLFELHKNQGGRGITKPHYGKLRHQLSDILLGKHPKYTKERLFSRLINNGYVEEKCRQCGFCQKRPTDLRTPLILNHINGNKSDHRLENLEVLCYNCFFVFVGDIRAKDTNHDSVIIGPEREEDHKAIMESPDKLAALSTMDLLSDEEKMDIISKLNNI
jgi:hypothetical protein